MPGELRDLPFALSLGGVAFILVAMWGNPFIEILQELRWGKSIIKELDSAGDEKPITPTSGGIIIIIPTFILTLGLNLVSLVREELTGQSILIPLFVLVGFGILGFIDDVQAILRFRGQSIDQGILPQAKFIGQLVLAGFVVSLLSFGKVQFADQMLIPLIPVPIDLPPWVWIPIAIFVIVGLSNAVHFSDDLDGLTGIMVATAFAAYGVIASLQGQSFLVQFAFIVVGACFGFLWYNAKPARILMGTVGSFSLGGALGVLALMTGQWLLLPFLAIIPMATSLSILIQAVYSRYSNGQVIPLHHYYRLGGWSDTQIVQRFWLVAILSAMIGIALVLL